MQPSHLLRIDSSAQREGSISRAVTDYLTQRLSERHPSSSVIHHDLGLSPLPTLTAEQLIAVHGSIQSDDPMLKSRQALSDGLVDELLRSDELVIGAPMYNFGIPATLKGWIDLICRAGMTFRYTEQGPQGLVGLERAFVVVSSGGTPVGGEGEFVSHYLTHLLHFVGVKRVEVIDASGSKREPQQRVESARAQIDALLS